VIAELKARPPSRGVIGATTIARARPGVRKRGCNRAVGAHRRALLQGHLDHLVAVRGAVGLPCLRKDFLVDPYQIDEARAFGADAVLVISRRRLGDAARRAPGGGARGRARRARRGARTKRELEWAIAVGATLVGINNRDLSTFVTTLETTERLAPLVRATCSSSRRAVSTRRGTCAG